MPWNATTVVNTIALMKGAHILRVHDVKEAKECVTLFEKNTMKLFDILDFTVVDAIDILLFASLFVLPLPIDSGYGSYQYFYGYRDDLPIVENHRSLADAIA